MGQDESQLARYRSAMTGFSIGSMDHPKCGSRAMLIVKLLELTYQGADRQATVREYQCPRNALSMTRRFWLS